MHVTVEYLIAISHEVFPSLVGSNHPAANVRTQPGVGSRRLTSLQGNEMARDSALREREKGAGVRHARKGMFNRRDGNRVWSGVVLKQRHLANGECRRGHRGDGTGRGPSRRGGAGTVGCFRATTVSCTWVIGEPGRTRIQCPDVVDGGGCEVRSESSFVGSPRVRRPKTPTRAFAPRRLALQTAL